MKRKEKPWEEWYERRSSIKLEFTISLKKFQKNPQVYKSDPKRLGKRFPHLSSDHPGIYSINPLFFSQMLFASFFSR